MKQFEYKALNPEGSMTNGTIESVSLENAAHILQEKKFLVIDVREKRSFSFSNISFGKGVSNREVATFTRLLSTMLSTGLPLVDAISNLAAQTRSVYFKEILKSILHDIQSGISLSESMARYPNVFNELYTNLVKAGEASGKIDDALGKLADTLESNLDFKAKVTGAMIYPAVVVGAMALIGVFMITTIIPKIADVYKEFGADLPLPTQILITISDVIKNYTIIVILFFILLGFTIKALKKNPVSDLVINNFMLKIPVFGLLSQEIILALIFQTLGTLLSSGVAILDALKIVTKTVSNNFFKTGLIEVTAYIEKGLPLSVAIKRNPDFPVMASQLLSVGEETGTVDQSLDRLAKFYQDSAERKVKNLTTLLEPVMILLMGGMVGGMAIAVLMPMFNLVNVIK